MLSNRLSGYFSSKTRSRGRDYAVNGFVEILEGSPRNEYWASVEGSSVYDVDVKITKNKTSWRVGVSCTCPYGDSHSDGCKHIWATLLELDEYAEFSSLPAQISMYYLDEDDGLSETNSQHLKPEILSLLPPSIVKKLKNTGLLNKLGMDIVTQTRFKATPKPKPKPKVVEPEWTKLFKELSNRTYVYSVPERPLKPIPELIYVLEHPSDGRISDMVITFGHRSEWDYGGYKEKRIGPEDIVRLENELDRRICLMIVGGGRKRYEYSNNSESSWVIDPGMRETILPLLFESGRFHQENALRKGIEQLSWDSGEPFHFELAMTPTKRKEEFELEGFLRRGDEKKSIDHCDVIYTGHPELVICNATLTPVQLHDSYPWLDSLKRNRKNVRVSSADRRPFLKALSDMQILPSVEWPASWKIDSIENVEPKPRLELNIDEPDSRTGNPAKYVYGTIKYLYDDVEVSATKPGAVVLDVDRERQVRRQIEAENRLASRLTALGMTPTQDKNLRLPQKQLPSLVAALLDEGWDVFGNRLLFRVGGEFKLDVATGIDWFDLNGHMDFDGQKVPLPALLEAARKGERFVRLGDGSMGVLPEEWIKKHQSLLGLGEVEGDSVRFARTQIGIVDVLLSQMPQANFDRQLKEARKKFHDFEGVKPCTPSKEFLGELRGYQKEGLGWLSFLREFGWNGCLADDMGLGKTVQVLAFLSGTKSKSVSGPNLVVMPKSLIFNWVREASRFAPHLSVIDYTGGEREQTRLTIPRADLVVTTYGTVRRDIEALREYEFNYVMLDEAQNVKNPTSLNSKCVRLLRAKHRLVLTGTPVENHVGDLWSLMEFLNPGMLGTQSAFNAAFRSSKNGNPVNENTELLQRMLRPFILRRTKEQVAPELPTRSEQLIECEMPPKQAEYYSEIRDYYRKSLMGRVDKQGLNKSKVHILEALLRLRQAACHPGLIDPKRTGLEVAKLETLFPKLEELMDEGHKALIFSQFTSFLSIVRKQLDKQKVRYEYLDGQTDHRNECVDRFQNDSKCSLFLISLKAGGIGLNLTAADYVFLLDPWWNPAVEAQAIDRTHRIGQEKKVIAYRLITRNTVESKIIELQQRKRELAGAIITQANSMLQDLTKEDLALLLS